MKQFILIISILFASISVWGQDTIVKKDTTANKQVRANSGTPGAGMDIVVRGRGTPGNDGPLYIVDGVVVGYEIGINPDDIESIAIQRDYYTSRSTGIVIIKTKSGRYSPNSKYTLRYPDYKKGSYNDFTKQIEQQLQPNAQKIGFTGSIDVRCTLDAKGALRVDNIPANIDYNFKQLLIQAIESDDEWTPATYKREPIEVNLLFEFEF